MRAKHPICTGLGVLVLFLGAVAPWLPAEKAPAPKARKVTGRVFVDVDGNGAYSPPDKPAAGVWVTDGLSRVRSDDEGKYEIQARPDPLLGKTGRAIVAVCFPEGTWPKGSWFQRIGANAGQVDFALSPRKAPEKFSFVHATDPHVPWGGTGPMRNFRADMARKAEDLDFVILTGDLVHVADYLSPRKARDRFQVYRALVRKFPLRIFALPGNHDLAGVKARGWKKGDPDYGYGLYHKHVGPLRWSFDYGGVHFVGIDCMARVEGSDELFRQRQADHTMAWLEADLKSVEKGKPILLFTHFPFRQISIAGLCVRYDVKVIFAGHLHTVGQYDLGPLRMRVSGSLTRIHYGSEKPGYRVVTVGKDGITSRYVQTNVKDPRGR